MKIRAKNGIQSIQAIKGGTDRPIHAEIVTNYNSGSGGLFFLSASKLIGSVNAHTLGGPGVGVPSITVSDDIEADLTFAGNVDAPINVYNGSLSAGRTIRIGGSLTSNGSISFAATELRGQIIINATNTTGAWLGTISVGSTQLSPSPYYTQKMSLLGGGAVGLASYNLSGQDCSPANGASVPIADITGSKVTLTHYGPVTTTGSTPFVVLARYRFGGSWQTITNDFKFTMYPNSNLRQVSIIPKESVVIGFSADYEYSIMPIVDPSSSDALRCLLVDGQPPLQSYTYGFTIIP